MNETSGKKYWITVNAIAWIIILVVSAFVFFPAFIAFLIIWGFEKIKVTD